MDVLNTIEELERQNSEWLAMRKIVHRRSRIELDRAYMRRRKEIRELRDRETQRKLKLGTNNNILAQWTCGAMQHATWRR